jgi:Uma2 family endonuclease
LYNGAEQAGQESLMTIGFRKHTVDELEAFEALPENKNRLWELINGEIVEKVPTQKHGMTAFVLGGLLFVHLQAYPEAGRGAIEVRHQMPGDVHNARIPDICIYTDMTTPPVEKGAVPRMPDFAIEIQSPDDSPEEMRKKAEYYLKNGSKLVWLLLSKTRSAEVCTLKNGVMHVETVGIDSTLTGGDVLPGFTVALKTLFPDP